MKESVLLNRLRAAQERYAVAALRTPQEKDAFEYGRHVGTVHGFELAIGELLSMVAEEEKDPL